MSKKVGSFVFTLETKTRSLWNAFVSNKDKRLANLSTFPLVFLFFPFSCCVCLLDLNISCIPGNFPNTNSKVQIQFVNGTFHVWTHKNVPMNIDIAATYRENRKLMKLCVFFCFSDHINGWGSNIKILI